MPNIVVSGYCSSYIESEINSLKNEKQAVQDKMSDIQATIDSLEFEKLSTIEKKELLDQKVMLTQQELDIIEEQIDILDGYTETIQNDLANARENENEARDTWLTRVRSMEESSDVTYFEVLFGANDFSDFISRLDTINEIYQYDSQLEQDYVEARKSVEELETKAADMEAKNEASHQEMDAKKAELEEDIQTANDYIASLEGDIDAQNDLLADEQAQQAAIEAKISLKEAELATWRAEEEQRKINEWIQQQAAIQQQEDPSEAGADNQPVVSIPVTTPMPGAPSFLWPSYSRFITDPYGYRVNPVTNIYCLHAGTDIGANYGSEIWAADDGIVISAGSLGGYGQCVMIHHANGYTTVYGHMSQINVSEGQTVSRGDVIGYVGSTGNSTGSHLHFEIRATTSNEPIDPFTFTYN